MRPPIPALVALALIPVAAAQDSPCPPGAALISYRVCPIANGFVSIVGDPGTVVVHGPAVPPLDDVVTTVPFPAGFAFDFYGVPKATLGVCTNGFVDFSAVPSNSFFNEHPGDAAVANDCVMPWHEDLTLTNPTSAVSYNLGFAPYGPGTLTIEWTDVATFTAIGAGVGSISFQAILYDATHPTLPNVIDYRYSRATAPPVMGPCAVSLTAGFSSFADTATVGTDSASGASATNVGVDATERGAANVAFPPNDLRLLPISFSGGEGNHSATMTVLPQEPYCSIVGLLDTVVVGPSCSGTPCYDDEQTATIDGAVIPLPWKFTLAGRSFRSVTMGANGYLKLGPGQWGVAGIPNTVLPGTAEPDGMLAAFWDDLESSAAGPAMFYRIDGAPGCRVMTFEWSHFGVFVGVSGDCLVAPGDVSFQVKLFEGSAGSLASSAGPCPYDLVVPGNGNDRVEYHYDHAGFAGALFTATIGWENHKGTVGGALAGSPAIAALPLDPAGGGPGKVVIDTCDFGVMRYYGDANTNAAAGVAACPPEILGNAVPPRIGNPFGLSMVGSSPLAFGFLLLDFGGPLPGTKLPVPCGGFPTPFGLFWVNPFGAASVILPCGLTTAGVGCAGSCKLDVPIPPDPTLIGGVVFAQAAALTPAPIPPLGLLIELSEGAKIQIGG